MVCIFKDTRELSNSILGAKTESKHHSHYFTLTLRVWTWTPMTCSTNLVAWPLNFNLWTLETFELQGSFTSISLTWQLHSNSCLELNNTAHQMRSFTLNTSSSFDSVMIVNLKQTSFQRQAICPQRNWQCLKVTITFNKNIFKVEWDFGPMRIQWVGQFSVTLQKLQPTQSGCLSWLVTTKTH